MKQRIPVEPVRSRVARERVHVGVLMGGYVDEILAGVKTIETRLSTTRRSPFGAVAPGERVYFKERGGGIRATAIIERVRCFDRLTPAMVRALRDEYGEAIRGTSEYWKRKVDAKYATLMWLREVEPVRFGPRVPVFYGSAWVTIPAAGCVYPACKSHAA